jgi:hypothetical protein
VAAILKHENKNLNYMTQEKTFLVGINRNSFRAGEPAEVIGLKMCQPSEMAEPRLCYEVEFGDGIIDYVPLSDNLNFDIISWTQLVNGNVPPVRN